MTKSIGIPKRHSCGSQSCPSRACHDEASTDITARPLFGLSGQVKTGLFGD